MRELFSEYGRAILSAVACLVIVAIFGVTVVAGESVGFATDSNGAVGKAGEKAEIAGSAQTGLSGAADIKNVNSKTNVIGEQVTVTSKSNEVKAGVVIPLEKMLVMVDASSREIQDPVYTLVSVVDGNHENCLKNGSVTYDRKNHAVTFNQTGFYSLTVRSSGEQLGRCSFGVYADAEK